MYYLHALFSVAEVKTHNICIQKHYISSCTNSSNFGWTDLGLLVDSTNVLHYIMCVHLYDK